MKRMIILFLVFLLLLPINLSVSATQVTGNQDELSLTVKYYSALGKPVVGAPLRLYKIASMDDAFHITADSRFASFRKQIEDEDTQWDALALMLNYYIMENDIDCDDEDTVDASGKVHFPTKNGKLLPGVYLVSGTRYRLNGKIYTPAPVIISLPNFDQDRNPVYHITSKIKFSFIEDVPVDVTVIKKWQDLGYKEIRPSEIKVQLLKNGWKVPGQEITLNEKNGWSYTWNDLDPLYYWSVVEECLDDYDVTYHRVEKDENVICTIINKYNPDEEKPDESVPGETEPDETVPDESKPDETEPNETEPDESKPDETKPSEPSEDDETKPDKPKPDKPKPDEPEKLPQTGQLTWPIPWMAISGMTLFFVGWVLSRDSKKERYEK